MNNTLWEITSEQLKDAVSKSGICLSCSRKGNLNSLGHNRRVIGPAIAELKSMIELHGFEAVGRMFGVSGNAIRKWIK